MNPFRKLFGSNFNLLLLELGQGRLWVVSLNQKSPEAVRFSEASGGEERERLLCNVEEAIEDQTRRLSEYDQRRHRILSIFSSSEAVSLWIKKKPFTPDSQMFAFTQIQMQTLVLFGKLSRLPAMTYVMLDPEMSQERELTPFEIRRTLEYFRF